MKADYRRITNQEATWEAISIFRRQEYPRHTINLLRPVRTSSANVFAFAITPGQSPSAKLRNSDQQEHLQPRVLQSRGGHDLESDSRLESSAIRPVEYRRTLLGRAFPDQALLFENRQSCGP